MAGYLKVAGLIPGRVEVSLSKAPYPNRSRRLGCFFASLTPPSVCECVHERVNVCPLSGHWLEKRYVKAFHYLSSPLFF